MLYSLNDLAVWIPIDSDNTHTFEKSGLGKEGLYSAVQFSVVQHESFVKHERHESILFQDSGFVDLSGYY